MPLRRASTPLLLAPPRLPPPPPPPPLLLLLLPLLLACASCPASVALRVCGAPGSATGFGEAARLCCARVRGDAVLDANASSAAYWSLPLLREVEGSLLVRDAAQLRALRLPALARVGGDVRVQRCPVLSHVALPRLRHVGGDVVARLRSEDQFSLGLISVARQWRDGAGGGGTVPAKRNAPRNEGVLAVGGRADWPAEVLGATAAATAPPEPRAGCQRAELSARLPGAERLRGGGAAAAAAEVGGGRAGALGAPRQSAARARWLRTLRSAPTRLAASRAAPGRVGVVAAASVQAGAVLLECTGGGGPGCANGAPPLQRAYLLSGAEVAALPPEARALIRDLNGHASAAAERYAVPALGPSTPAWLAWYLRPAPRDGTLGASVSLERDDACGALRVVAQRRLSPGEELTLPTGAGFGALLARAMAADNATATYYAPAPLPEDRKARGSARHALLPTRDELLQATRKGPHLRVQPSVHGVGLFAASSMPRGTLATAPVDAAFNDDADGGKAPPQCRWTLLNADSWSLSEDDFYSLPRAVRNLSLDMYFLAAPTSSFAAPRASFSCLANTAVFLNHASEAPPNVEWVRGGGNCLSAVPVLARDVLAGEELRESYTDFTTS